MNVNIDEELASMEVRKAALRWEWRNVVDQMKYDMKRMYEGKVPELGEIALSTLFYEMMKEKGLE